MVLILFTATILVTVAYVVLNKILFSVMQIPGTRKRLSKKGIEANATLLNMEKTGLYINNEPQVKMQVQVHVRNGRNFVSELCEVFTAIDMNQLRAGSTLRVKYNPANTREIMVVNN